MQGSGNHEAPSPAGAGAADVDATRRTYLASERHPARLVAHRPLVMGPDPFLSKLAIAGVGLGVLSVALVIFD